MTTDAGLEAVLVSAFQRTDPALTPQERETTIRFAADQSQATIFTAQAGIGRRLIAHPHSTIESVVVTNNGSRYTIEPPIGEPEGDVVGVTVTLPIGVLTIKANPRTTGGPADVVTKHVLEEVTQ